MTFVHPGGICESPSVGEGTRVWAFAHVLPGAVIGADCNICDHVFVENDVVVGDRVTIKSGVQLWDGIRVGDDVFIGPNATFTNDPFPRSKVYPDAFPVTTIATGASIGANATILPGISIGRKAMVGAGSVVTRDVPPNAIVVGNPARIVGYTDAEESATAASAPSTSGEVTQSLVDGVQLVHLTHAVDMRGSLTAGEAASAVPFVPRRFFTVFDVPSKEVRGEHAHRVCEQFLVAVSGSVTVVVDDASRRQQFLLDRPQLGLYLPPMVWGIQYKYSADAVLLVLASHPYDADDYIRDYDDFLAVAGGQPAS